MSALGRCAEVWCNGICRVFVIVLKCDSEFGVLQKADGAQRSSTEFFSSFFLSFSKGFLILSSDSNIPFADVNQQKQFIRFYQSLGEVSRRKNKNNQTFDAI